MHMDYFSRTFPADTIINARALGWETAPCSKHSKEAGIPDVESMRNSGWSGERVAGGGGAAE